MTRIGAATAVAAAAFAATAVVLALGSSPAVGSRFGTEAVGCGTINVLIFGEKHPSAYLITMVAGHVTCATAESTLRSFLTKDVSRSGWFCVRGHSSQGQQWAAACDRSDGALIRAFGPVHA